MCNCEKCTTRKIKQEKAAIKRYNEKCECGCKHGNHLQLIHYNPNYTAGKCMDCNNCKRFIIKK